MPLLGLLFDGAVFLSDIFRVIGRYPHFHWARVMSGTTAVLLPVYAVVFVGFLGYATMIATYAAMIMGGNGFLPDDASHALRSLTAGLLLAMYPLGQFLGSPVLGAMSDRFGRKPVLLLTLALTLLCYVGIASALQWPRLGLLMSMCFVCGLSEANITVAQSVIADRTTPDERGRQFGYMWVVCSLSYVIGPLFGGMLALHEGYAVPFWAMTGLLAATWGMIAWGFKETHAAQPGRPAGYFKAFVNLTQVLTDRPIRGVYWANFLVYFGVFGFFRVIALYWLDRWQMSVGQIAMFYAYLSGCCLVANLVLTPWLTRRLSLKAIYVSAAVLGAVAMVGVLLPPQAWSTWYTVGITSLVIALILPAGSAILSLLVSPDRQGAVMGNNQALQVGSEALAAAVGGVLAALWMPLPLLTCAAAILGGGLLLLGRRVRPAGA